MTTHLVDKLMQQLQTVVAEGCHERWWKRQRELHTYAKDHNMNIWPKGQRFRLHAINDVRESTVDDDGTNSRGMSEARKKRRLTSDKSNRNGGRGTGSGRRGDGDNSNRVGGGGGGGGGSSGGGAGGSSTANRTQKRKRTDPVSGDIRILFTKQTQQQSPHQGVT